MSLPEAFAVFVKFFFILTPFFIMAIFIAMTDNESVEVRHQLAIRITVAVIVISLILFFGGATIFELLGITVDAFRIGAGALLFLSAVSLVEGKIQLWDEGTKNGPDRSALLGHNFVYQETKPHGFYSSYFHQRISS